MLLKEHLATKYIQRNRRWLVLFPEGGFLKKRIVKGQQYAQRNNLPILHNITLPRLGALNGIRDILVDTEAAANSAELENKGGLLETKGICRFWRLFIFIDWCFSDSINRSPILCSYQNRGDGLIDGSGC